MGSRENRKNRIPHVTNPRLGDVSLSQVTVSSVFSPLISVHELSNEVQCHACLRACRSEDFKDERHPFSPTKRSEARCRKAWIGNKFRREKLQDSSLQPAYRANDSNMVHRRQETAFGSPQVKLLLPGTYFFGIQKTLVRNFEGLDTLPFHYGTMDRNPRVWQIYILETTSLRLLSRPDYFTEKRRRSKDSD